MCSSDLEQVAGSRPYTVQFGSERASKINTAYHQVEPGESFLIFNSLGLLEIGMCYGNGSQLLGLGYDSPVNIIFEEPNV